MSLKFCCHTSDDSIRIHSSALSGFFIHTIHTWLRKVKFTWWYESTLLLCLLQFASLKHGQQILCWARVCLHLVLKGHWTLGFVCLFLLLLLPPSRWRCRRTSLSRCRCPHSPSGLSWLVVVTGFSTCWFQCVWSRRLPLLRRRTSSSTWGPRFVCFVCLERSPSRCIRHTLEGEGRGPLYEVPVSRRSLVIKTLNSRQERHYNPEHSFVLGRKLFWKLHHFPKIKLEHAKKPVSF